MEQKQPDQRKQIKLCKNTVTNYKKKGKQKKQKKVFMIDIKQYKKIKNNKQINQNKKKKI